jgi:hypothetical protein
MNTPHKSYIRFLANTGLQESGFDLADPIKFQITRHIFLDGSYVVHAESHKVVKQDTR